MYSDLVERSPRLVAAQSWTVAAVLAVLVRLWLAHPAPPAQWRPLGASADGAPVYLDATGVPASPGWFAVAVRPTFGHAPRDSVLLVKVSCPRHAIVAGALPVDARHLAARAIDTACVMASPSGS